MALKGHPAPVQRKRDRIKKRVHTFLGSVLFALLVLFKVRERLVTFSVAYDAKLAYMFAFLSETHLQCCNGAISFQQVFYDITCTCW